MESVRLSYTGILMAVLMGSVLSVLYLSLLWYSIKVLPKIKMKGLFLFISVLFRLSLFLFFAIYLSQNHVGRFLWIIVGFILTRLVFLSCIKNKRRKK